MKLDGLLERSEREKMFREEYTLRRINNHFKQHKIRWHEANLFLMAQEDHLAASIRAEDQKERAMKKNLIDQQQKVKALLKQEEEREREKETVGKIALQVDILSYDYLQHVKLKDETLPEVATLVQKVFQIDGEGCPSNVICNCHHEWTSSLKLMKACAKRVDTAVREAIDISSAVVTMAGKVRRLEHDAADGNYSVRKYVTTKNKVPRVPCRVDFYWKPDKNCSQKYRSVRKLQAYRLLRRDKLRALLNSGELFKQLHQSLLEVRRRLRVEKFASRKERRPVLDQAIELENQMDALESTILANCIEICENGRLEKMNFFNLFCVHIGAKQANKPQISKEKKLPGYMQKKKEVGPIVTSGTNRHNHDRKKMEYSATTGQMREVVDEGGDSEADDDQYTCPAACTICPKGDNQLQMLHTAPPLPSYILLHLHLKRTETEQKKAAEQQKKIDQEENSASLTTKKSVLEKKSLLKSAALNSPLTKFERAQSPPPSACPTTSSNTKRKNKAVKRQSINVIHQPTSLRVGVGTGEKGSKVPRKSMEFDHSDEDILRSKTLLEDVIDVELDKVIPKEGTREIAGLSKYPSEETLLYLPLVRIEEIKKWSHDISRWYEDVEQKWKQSKSALCLSFLQRARLLLTGGVHKQVHSDDASLAERLQRANALDLVELLCCRSTLIMRVCNPCIISM